MVTTAAPYYTLRSVRFESAEDFIDEVKSCDGPFMSATLGLAMDYVTSTTQEDNSSTPTKFQARGTFHAIYEHGQLILVLVQTPLRPATHFIGYPHPPQPPLLSAACARLAKTVSPSLLSGHLAGPRDALTAFLPHLPGLQISASLHSSLVCTANLRTLPARTAEPPSATEYGDPVVRYHIRKGRPEDAPALLPLVQELLTPTPAGPPPPERILADMRAATQRGLLYVVSTAGVGSADARDGKGEETATPELAGYLLLGSATPLVVWIRNVLIHAAHRRRGLAERLVSAVTRACLGVSETVLGDSRRGVSVSVDVGVPGCGVKSSVCLRFSDPGAGRVYGRCGFVVDEAATDPGTGEKLCYPYDLRSVTQP